MQILKPFAVFFTALLIMSLFNCKQESNIKEKKVAVITYINGEAVRIVDSAEESLHNGDVLKSGTIIKTMAGAVVDVTFSDKSIVRLKENSSLTLSLMGITNKGGMVTDLELKKGIIMNVVSKIEHDGYYDVKAPTAIAGVRGTIFEVSADKKQRFSLQRGM